MWRQGKPGCISPASAAAYSNATSHNNKPQSKNRKSIMGARQETWGPGSPVSPPCDGYASQQAPAIRGSQ